MQYKGYGVPEPKSVASQDTSAPDREEITRLRQEKALLLTEMRRLQARIEVPNPVSRSLIVQPPTKIEPKLPEANRSQFSEPRPAHTAP